MPEFIPVGRTSLARRGDTMLQVQTEYAARPNPRIATTISENGRVVHKVERPLEQPITSFEEQRLIESQMRQQHASVVGTIEGHEKGSRSATMPEPKRGLPSLVSTASTDDKTQPPTTTSLAPAQDYEPTIITRSSALMGESTSAPKPEPSHASLSFGSSDALVSRPFAATHRPPADTMAEMPSILDRSQRRVDPKEDTFTMKSTVPEQPPVTMAERLRRVDGVQRLIELDAKGKFVDDDKTSAQFRKMFAPVLKNLQELLAFFVIQEDGTRERGFYPIDPGRLYLVSTGESFFFLLVYAAENPDEIERRIREMI